MDRDLEEKEGLRSRGIEDKRVKVRGVEDKGVEVRDLME